MNYEFMIFIVENAPSMQTRALFHYFSLKYEIPEQRN